MNTYINVLLALSINIFLFDALFIATNSSNLVNNIFMRKKLTQPKKYILLWEQSNEIDYEPFGILRQGFRNALIKRKCRYSNCYISTNKTLLGDYTKFDAIFFNGRLIINHKDLPRRRSSNQIYVFVQLESADNYPVCDPKFNNYFNRTFTYRLDSDFSWPYIRIVARNKSLIGPKQNMQWMSVNQMKPIRKDIKEMLRTKHVAASWFVSHCHTRSRRENFVAALQRKLKR